MVVDLHKCGNGYKKIQLRPDPAHAIPTPPWRHEVLARVGDKVCMAAGCLQLYNVTMNMHEHDKTDGNISVSNT